MIRNYLNAGISSLMRNKVYGSINALGIGIPLAYSVKNKNSRSSDLNNQGLFQNHRHNSDIFFQGIEFDKPDFIKPK